jgi:signal transduction histidine kinase
MLLAKYYGSCLTPKSGKIPGRLIIAAFGGAYFISQYLVKDVLPGLPIAAFGRAVILIILVFALSLIFFKRNLRLNLFLLFSFFAAQEICEYILLSIGQTFGNAHKPVIDYLVENKYITTGEQFLSAIDRYVVFQFFVSLIIYATIAAFTLRTITKRFIQKDYALSTSELSYLLLPCLPGLAITHIVRALLIRQNDPYGYYEVYNEVPFIDLLVPLSGFILLFSMIAAVKLFQRLVVLHNEEIERSVLQKQIRQFQRQINDVDGIYTEIKSLRHDIKNHVSNILILANAIVEGNTDVKGELEGYLKKIGEALDEFDFVYKTGNSVSDIIVHQKHHESINSGIDFTADFIYPNHLNIDAYDLAVILMNALENAVEACAEMKDGFIRLYAYTKGNMFFIEVENSCVNAITLDEKNGLPRSGKQDKTVHGMGLSNIRRCAERYFGDIDIQASEAKNHNVFRLTVMLQGRD